MCSSDLAQKEMAVFNGVRQGNCIACHEVTALKNEPYHGNTAPSLDGVASRMSEGELRLRVVGVYRSENVFFDAGAYAPLETVQELARKPDVVTAVFITAASGTDPQALATSIEDTFPDLTTVASVGEYGKVDQGIQVMDALNLAVTVLALGLGGIAVMNTMIMAVFERTREFGILRAVGWRGSRIMRLVLTESLLLCLVAAVFGAAFGILATRGVMLIEEIRTFLEPTYTLEVFARALLVAAGELGGIVRARLVLDADEADAARPKQRLQLRECDRAVAIVEVAGAARPGDGDARKIGRAHV